MNNILQVIGHLIDWNALENFGEIIQVVKQYLMNAEAQPVLKKYRKNCIRVIHAVADKGMDYPLKIEVLMGLEYTQLMGSFQIKYRDRQMQDGAIDEE